MVSRPHHCDPLALSQHLELAADDHKELSTLLALPNHFRAGLVVDFLREPSEATESAFEHWSNSETLRSSSSFAFFRSGIAALPQATRMNNLRVAPLELAGGASAAGLPAPLAENKPLPSAEFVTTRRGEPQ